MTELELKKALGQEIEIPAQVEERIRQACAQTKTEPQKVRRSRRPLRTVLAVAAVVAVLSASAAAVVINRGGVYQALFGTKGNSQIEAEVQYNEYGMITAKYLNEERLPVDEELAEALVGDYIQHEPVVWNVGDYTLTVESWFIDEYTGTGKIYYTLECPGGVVGLTVDEKDSHCYVNGEGLYLIFSILGGETNGRNGFTDYRTYADLENSTPERLVLVTSVARGSAGSWTAADGIEVRFGDYRNWTEDEAAPEELLILPGTSSLPAVAVEDPETGEPVAVFSAVGIKIWAELDTLDDVTLTYADGSRYVVFDDAEEIQNTSCEFWDTPREWNEQAEAYVRTGDDMLMCCFNRLVDPVQVVAVTVNGTTYIVN